MRTRPTTAAPLRVPPVCGNPGRRPADLSRVLRAGRAGRSGRRRQRSRDGIRGRACDDWTCSQCAPGGRRLCVPSGRLCLSGSVGRTAGLKGGRLSEVGGREGARPGVRDAWRLRSASPRSLCTSPSRPRIAALAVQVAGRAARQAPTHAASPSPTGRRARHRAVPSEPEERAPRRRLVDDRRSPLERTAASRLGPLPPCAVGAA